MTVSWLIEWLMSWRIMLHTVIEGNYSYRYIWIIYINPLFLILLEIVFQRNAAVNETVSHHFCSSTHWHKSSLIAYKWITGKMTETQRCSVFNDKHSSVATAVSTSNLVVFTKSLIYYFTISLHQNTNHIITYFGVY